MSTGILRLFRIEARRNLGLWVFPFAVIAVWYLSAEERADGIWLWPDISVSIEGTLAVVGPMAAGLAAWTASRNRRRGTEELLATTPYPAASRDFAAWFATAAWLSLAYAAAAGFIHLIAFWDGAWGSPILWPVLVGFFALLAHSALGYAVGHYLPSGFTAPLIAVTLFLLQITPVYFSSSVHHLAPLGESLTRSVFHGVLPNLFFGQTLWFLGLAGVALATVALKRSRNIVVITMTIATVSTATLGAILLLEKPPWASPAKVEAATVSSYEPVCVTKEIPVCVHPAYEALLPEVAPVVSEISSPLVDLPGGPTRAEQVYSSFATPEPGTVSFFLYDRNSLGDVLASQVTGDLVGRQTPAVLRDNGDTPNDAQIAIEAWLLHQSGRDSEYAIFAGGEPEAIAAAAQRFAELAPKGRDEWLRKNYSGLRAGKLKLKDLP